MDPYQRMEYLLGRTIAINLPTQTSRLNPTNGDLKLIAQRFGMGIEQVRSALAFFNAHEKNVSRSEQWRTLLHDKARTLDDVDDLRPQTKDSQH
jgi:hypothetical protein